MNEIIPLKRSGKRTFVTAVIGSPISPRTRLSFEATLAGAAIIAHEANAERNSEPQPKAVELAYPEASHAWELETISKYFQQVEPFIQANLLVENYEIYYFAIKSFQKVIMAHLQEAGSTTF